MYSMVETNVQQLVEVVLGAATMAMAVAGFRNLSGCECGCGVSCAKHVGYAARWVCPRPPPVPCPAPAPVGRWRSYQTVTSYNRLGQRLAGRLL